MGLGRVINHVYFGCKPEPEVYCEFERTSEKLLHSCIFSEN